MVHCGKPWCEEKKMEVGRTEVEKEPASEKQMAELLELVQPELENMDRSSHFVRLADEVGQITFLCSSLSTYMK